MLSFNPRVTKTDFDENIFQGHDPICSIRAQELIMRDFGIQIPKEQLTEFATEQGWFSGHGTKRKDIGNLLETCNIGTHSKHCESVYDLINELKDGHRVIVSVDSHELWAKPGTPEYEFYRNLPHADHSLIVTSIKIDVNHPENSTVVLTDPGQGSIVEYNFEHFAHAWKDSRFFMMATDEAAPYQYNAEAKCMEVSNFATEHSMQQFPFHNEFSDIYQIDELGYVPYYEDGHLDNLFDGMSYDDFINEYGSDSFSDLDDSFNMVNFDEDMIKIDVPDVDGGYPQFGAETSHLEDIFHEDL